VDIREKEDGMGKPLTVKVLDDHLEIGPLRVSFQRTVRVPETGVHDLPAGFGGFPLRRVRHYPDTAPAEWLTRGGVMLPIHPFEAMWMSFDAEEPTAVQVGTGKTCAVTGAAWSDELVEEPQNYVAVPTQPWLDGFRTGEGEVRQFVGVALGRGATVEAQLTGAEVYGGIQLRAAGLTEEARRRWASEREHGMVLFCCSEPDMGMGAGGRIRQEIYRDDRPVADYDDQRAGRVFVHLCAPEQWTAITGERPPESPIDHETCVRLGVPWFRYEDADHADLPAGDELASVETVGGILGTQEQPFTPVDPGVVVTLKGGGGDTVHDGTW